MTGEFEFLAAWRSRLGVAPPGQVWMGDDTAVLDDGLLLAVDTLVERIHFRLDWCTAADVGFKSLVVNLSDIAAMGGTPVAAVVAVTLPTTGGTTNLADELMDGLSGAANQFQCPLVGGDTTSGPTLVISVSVLGRCDQPPVLRSGAGVGDTVFVTGPIGGARTALKALLDDRSPDPSHARRLHRPTPRLDEGKAAAAGGATSLIDLSDGLGGDLRHLGEASGVGFSIEEGSLPLQPGVSSHAAIDGGDDYELCFTAPDPETIYRAFERASLPTPIAIGHTTAETARTLIDIDGHHRPLPHRGWEHSFGAAPDASTPSRDDWRRS